MVAVLMSLNVTAFANDRLVMNGSIHLKMSEYDALNVNGNLTFHHLVIKNSIVINGSVQGENLTCTTFQSHGSVDINGLNALSIKSNGSFKGNTITVTGASEFNGEVEIKKGHLQDLQIASTTPTFIDTEIHGSILIKKAKEGWHFFGFASKASSTQVLKLKGQTCVTGDISFEEGGEVHLIDGAKVEGKITNAKVIQK